MKKTWGFKQWIVFVIIVAYIFFFVGPVAHFDRMFPDAWGGFSKVMVTFSVCLGIAAGVILVMAILVAGSGKEKARPGEDWADKKRFFGIPLSFTRYSLSGEKLLIETGILNKKVDQIMLYRVVDFTLKEDLFERIFGVGTVHICSADHSKPEIDIAHIKNANKVKDMLSDKTEAVRERKGIATQEFILPSSDM